MQLINKIKSIIKKYSMLRHGDRVLVGVSGGPDSMALLDILNELKNEFNLQLAVAHLNHGLRGKESNRDEDFVKRMTKIYGLKCYSKKLRRGFLKMKGVSPEESARKARHKYFEFLLKKKRFTRIALGHTADDQAETVLMRFLRGSGLRGISGIPPVRKSGEIIRPLIGIWKTDVKTYLKQKKIDYVIDSTNISQDFLRNRIRNNLIPYLEKNFNPNIKNNLVRMAEIFSMEEKMLDRFTKMIEKDVLLVSGDSAFVNLEKFNLFDRGARIRLIQKAIETILGDLKQFGSAHFENILSLASGSTPNTEIALPRSLICGREYNRIKIYTKKDIKNNKLSEKINVKLNINGKTILALSGMTIKSKVVLRNKIKSLIDPDNLAYLDLDKLAEPLFFRNYIDGDRFIPLGSQGSKKLKDFFIDEKVPKDIRRRIPILISGSSIAWVAGYRIDERFRVIRNTKRVLSLEIKQR